MGEPATELSNPTLADEELQKKFPAVMKVEHVAAMLELNRKTVYEMVQRHEIPGVRSCGRALRFHRDAVIAWLRDGDGRARRRTR